MRASVTCTTSAQPKSSALWLWLPVGCPLKMSEGAGVGSPRGGCSAAPQHPLHQDVVKPGRLSAVSGRCVHHRPTACHPAPVIHGVTHGVSPRPVTYSMSPMGYHPGLSPSICHPRPSPTEYHPGLSQHVTQCLSPTASPSTCYPWRHPRGITQDCHPCPVTYSISPTGYHPAPVTHDLSPTACHPASVTTHGVSPRACPRAG